MEEQKAEKELPISEPEFMEKLKELHGNLSMGLSMLCMLHLISEDLIKDRNNFARVKVRREDLIEELEKLLSRLKEIGSKNTL